MSVKKNTPKPSRTYLSPSNTTQQVVRKQNTAAAKFSNRVRPSVNESSAPSPTSLSSSRPIRAVSPPSASSNRNNQNQVAPKGGFNRPTAASLARAQAINTTSNSNSIKRPETPSASEANKRIRAASSGAPSQKSPPSTPQRTPQPSRVLRRNSFTSAPPLESGPMLSQRLRTKHSSEQLGRSELGSGVALYNQYWEDGDIAR